jgi:hypothetical protein
MRLSNGLLKYMQISFAVGFLGIANDLVNILRVYLVNPTYGSEKYDECPAWGDEKADRAEGADSVWKSSNRRLVLGVPVSRPRPHIEGAFPGQPPENTPDHPRTRFWARRFSDFTNLAFLAASVPGGVINAQFQTVIDDPDKSNRIMTIRWSSFSFPFCNLAHLEIDMQICKYCRWDVPPTDHISLDHLGQSETISC